MRFIVCKDWGRSLICLFTIALSLNRVNVQDAIADSGKTTLRVVGSPTGTFESSSLGTNITGVTVEVRNVGSNEAENVRVHAILPNGKTVEVDGPSIIAPNKTEIFTKSMFELVSNTKKIEAKTSCSNCR